MELGAITLMLDFDASMIEITGVEMPGNGGEEPWIEVQGSKFKVQNPALNIEPATLNVLQIGWMSLNPIDVVPDQPIFLIHARLVNNPSRISHPASLIHFTLNENPLSELADGQGNVIYGAKLAMPDAIGNGEMDIVNIYPNPAVSILNIEFVLQEECHVNLELVNLQGAPVMKSDLGLLGAGLQTKQLELGELAPGVCFLHMTMGEQMVVKKVVIRNR